MELVGLGEEGRQHWELTTVGLQWQHCTGGKRVMNVRRLKVFTVPQQVMEGKDACPMSSNPHHAIMEFIATVA